jgi:hypothetical protein
VARKYVIVETNREGVQVQGRRKYGCLCRGTRRDLCRMPWAVAARCKQAGRHGVGASRSSRVLSVV